MEISSISAKLSEYLSGKDIIKETKSGSKLISWSIRTSQIFESGLIPDSEKICFAFSKPVENFSFYAAGEVLTITENGNGRFHAIDKKIKNIKDKLISNWGNSGLRVPLFTGGMKFTVEHNDSDWKDFQDSNWIVPELIILKENDENYLIYNFYYTRNSDPAEVVKDLTKKINQLLTPKRTEENKLKILSTTGQSPKDRKKWKNMVHKALDSILDNEAQKIVLSRRVELTLNKEPDYDILFKELESEFPGCAVFLMKNNSSFFFGASPERLVTFHQNKLCVDALAGSGKDELKDLFTEKNIREHNFVLEYLKNTISPLCENVELTKDHDTKKLNNISHIWSEISAEIKDGTPYFLIVKDLFPTPAVCGTPKDAAMNLIKKLEDHRRGLYAGTIGWFNFSEAEFYVSIRSALGSGRKVIGYAGCGIVDGSDAEEEFNETELKLIPVLSLFKHENKNQPQYSLG
jgi:menaquinone-specific isochorismate synthase